MSEALDLGPIKSRLAKASAGPWRWELNQKSKRLQLCGGVPRFDLIVMDFVRWGMNGACPRFNKELRTNMNVMERAEMYGVDQPGREHHASWFQLLRHHDAQLIEHAPADIAALVNELESLRSQLAAANERAEVAERKFGKLMAWAASKRSNIHIWWDLVGITGGRTPEDQVRRASGLEEAS